LFANGEAARLDIFDATLYSGILEKINVTQSKDTNEPMKPHKTQQTITTIYPQLINTTLLEYITTKISKYYSTNIKMQPP
jgi:hypothetical protein